MNEELNQEELTPEEAKASLGISTRLLNLMLGISDEQQMKMAEQNDRLMQQSEMQQGGMGMQKRKMMMGGEQEQENEQGNEQGQGNEQEMENEQETEGEDTEEEDKGESEKEGMDMEELKPEIEKIIKSTLSQEIGKLRSDLQSLLTEESNEKNNGEQKQD